MSKVRLKWKRGALKKLRHDPRIAQFLLKKADQIAADAGGKDIGYMVTNLVLEEPRTAVSVMATGHASNHNRKYHSLLREIGRARRRCWQNIYAYKTQFLAKLSTWVFYFLQHMPSYYKAKRMSRLWCVW